MANRIKYNSGVDANSLNIGNWSVGLQGTGMGPTAITGFQNGVQIPENGYAIYSQGVNARIAADADELVFILNKLGAGVQDDDVAAAINWARDNNVLVLSDQFNNISSDNLVLNLDAKQSYSFTDTKPTVNLVSNWNLNSGWSKGYQRNIVFDEIAPPTGVNTPTVGFNRGTTSAYWYSYGDYTPQVPGETYTVSMYVKTNDPSFAINFYTANNQETGRFWSGHIAVPNDGHWHRVVWPSFLNPTNSQSDSLSFNMQMSGEYENASQNRTWLCAPQMQQGTVATPFVAGTRTQGTEWNDLSGNNNPATLINGVALDSNEGLSFDGVNDYAVLNTFNNKPTTQITCESLIKPMKSTLSGTIRGGAISASNSMYLGIIDSVDGGNTHAMHWANQTSIDRKYNWNGSVPDNRWSHLVGTYDGTTSRAYVNGVEISSWAQNGTIPDATYYIGTYGGTVVDGTHNFDGNIETARIYNTALTSQDVSRNYYGGPIVTSGLIHAIDAGNLVSYEPGSATTYNLTGTGTGTLTNGVGFDKSNGGSWTFDGVDDYIRLNNPLTVTQPYTILMWLKPDVLGTGASSTNRSTPLKGNGHWNPGIWVTQDMIRSHGDTRYVDSYIDWSGLEYAQIGMIFDGTTVYNIFNGQILPNFLSNSYNPGVPSEILIGAENTGGLNTWDGSISNTTCYQRALSQEEVLQNYNAQAARFK